MNITEIKNTDTDFHVRVTIPSEDISSKVEEELTKLAKNAKVDGFRAGKVPASFLKKKYGVSLRADVIKGKIIKAMDDVVKDRNLRIIMDPEIDDLKDEENKDLEFTLKYQLLPEIQIPDFKKISIEKPVLELKDKDINDYIEKLKGLVKEYSKESKAKAKKGDQVTIDAVGYVNGKEFAGGELKSYKLVLGSGVFIPGFEDQLIGSTSGDDVSVKVEFPKNYHEKTLAGKPSEFKVKVLAVHNESKINVDDEFAKKFGLENLEQLKVKVSVDLQELYSDSIETMMKMELFDKLENILTFEIPKSLVDREISILRQQVSNLEDDELKNSSEEEKEAYFNKLALRRVKLGLMLAEYVKLKNLKIDKSDINKAVIDQAKLFPNDSQAVIDFYVKNPSALESLKGPILEEKAVKDIFANEVKLIEKPYSKSKLDKLLEKNDEQHTHEYGSQSHIHEHTHGDHDHTH